MGLTPAPRLCWTSRTSRPAAAVSTQSGVPENARAKKELDPRHRLREPHDTAPRTAVVAPRAQATDGLGRQCCGERGQGSEGHDERGDERRGGDTPHVDQTAHGQQEWGVRAPWPVTCSASGGPRRDEHEHAGQSDGKSITPGPSSPVGPAAKGHSNERRDDDEVALEETKRCSVSTAIRAAATTSSAISEPVRGCVCGAGTFAGAKSRAPIHDTAPGTVATPTANVRSVPVESVHRAASVDRPERDD